MLFLRSYILYPIWKSSVGAYKVELQADADDLDAAKAILAGLKDRYESTGKKAILIHTSGTGTLADNALGKFTSDTIYDDSNPDQIAKLPPTQQHRNVDLEIVEADKQGYVDTYIVLPSTIYGLAKGPLVDLGIHNTFSVQIPWLVRFSIKRGQAGVVGEGKNIWPHVSNEDIADLYITLYDAIKAGHPAAGHGREGYYFGENGEYNGYEVSKLVAQGLAKHGIGKRVLVVVLDGILWHQRSLQRKSISCHWMEA
jgi:hypothetical protein